MIKERTKFNNGLERHKYMGEMTHEFMDVYDEGKNLQPDKQINRVNVTLIRSINEYMERYIYFQRVTSVIVEFLRNLSEIDKEMMHKLIDLKSSAKQQNSMIATIKVRLKKYNFDKKYEVPLAYTIKKIDERLDYLLKLVSTAYIDLTPLSSYSKKLESEGKSFYDEILEEFPLDILLGDTENNEVLQDYIKRVLTSISDNGDWQEEYKNYQKFLKNKYDAYDKLKAEEKEKKKKERQEATEGKLMMTSNDIRRNYRNALLEGKYISGYYELIRQIEKYKLNGRQENKIVLIAKTASGARARVGFYSAEEEDMITYTLKNCTVLGEFDNIPTSIQEKIDSHDLAMIEILF